MEKQKKITVEVAIEAPVETVWKVWNTPSDIVKWNTADPSWHCPNSVNNLRIGGTFKNRMEARDGSFGFDFEGVYTKVDLYREIAYVMGDGREVVTFFSEKLGKTIVTSTFDPETVNDPEFQKQGWQAILNSFATYVVSTY